MRTLCSQNDRAEAQKNPRVWRSSLLSCLAEEQAWMSEGHGLRRYFNAPVISRFIELGATFRANWITIKTPPPKALKPSLKTLWLSAVRRIDCRQSVQCSAGAEHSSCVVRGCSFHPFTAPFQFKDKPTKSFTLITNMANIQCSYLVNESP